MSQLTDILRTAVPTTTTSIKPEPSAHTASIYHTQPTKNVRFDCLDALLTTTSRVTTASTPPPHEHPHYTRLAKSRDLAAAAAKEAAPSPARPSIEDPSLSAPHDLNTGISPSYSLTASNWLTSNGSFDTTKLAGRGTPERILGAQEEDQQIDSEGFHFRGTTSTTVVFPARVVRRCWQKEEKGRKGREDEQQQQCTFQIFCWCRERYVDGGRPLEPMIRCANRECPIGGWFHHRCIGYYGGDEELGGSDVREDQWYCPGCNVEGGDEEVRWCEDGDGGRSGKREGDEPCWRSRR